MILSKRRITIIKWAILIGDPFTKRHCFIVLGRRDTKESTFERCFPAEAMDIVSIGTTPSTYLHKLYASCKTTQSIDFPKRYICIYMYNIIISHRPCIKMLRKKQ